MFDGIIKKVAACVEEWRTEGKKIREFHFPGTASLLKEGLPISVGNRANSGIILREDTRIELGGPDAGSCACFLVTEDLSLLQDGKITLIGPDIPETSGPSLPFGQVVVMGGSELGLEEPELLQHLRFIGDQIEGYMVRSLSQNLWSRVSKNAAAKGFNFEILGRALMAVYKSQNYKIQAVEILFVTSSKEDVMVLSELESRAEKIRKQLQKDHWKIRGYDIDCDLDCSVCDDKAVCDELRKVLQAKMSVAGKKTPHVRGKGDTHPIPGGC